MSLRQLKKLRQRQPAIRQRRIFSTSRLWSNSVGYGDLWDNEQNCPDHGHFKDDPNKSWAGETVAVASESCLKNVADNNDAMLKDVDDSLRRHDAKTKKGPINVEKSESDTGNSRSATGYN